MSKIKKILIIIAIALIVFIIALLCTPLEQWNLDLCIFLSKMVDKFIFPAIATIIGGLVVVYITEIKDVFFERDYKEVKQLYDEGKHDIAFPKFKELAEKGYAKAQFNLAQMCYKGQGIVKNEKKAFEWYHKAAGQGYSEAQTNLGILYEDRGDNDNAFKWYRKAAKKEDSKAQNNLGLMYANKGEYDEAFKWYSKAIEQGNPKAKNNLGGLYYNGFGVKKDLDKAEKLARESAEEGNAGSQYNLGAVFENELQNYEEAFKWYSKAAEQEILPAQYKIAIMYCNGNGVSKSFTKAYMWGTITLANDKLDEEYKEKTKHLLQELVAKMTFADITKAKEMAKRCMESDYEDCGEE